MFTAIIDRRKAWETAYLFFCSSNLQNSNQFRQQHSWKDVNAEANVVLHAPNVCPKKEQLGYIGAGLTHP
jgi:hypothetical protein